MVSPAGIVTGLVHEAEIARRASGNRHQVLCLGPGPDRAAAAAEQLAARGARLLLSLGVAGGLDGADVPGTLLVPETVIDGVSGQPYPADDALATCIRSALLARPDIGRTVAAPLVTSREPITGISHKQQLKQRFMAAAVDMESAAVARVAQAHGLPFVALRVVLDSGDMHIPPAAMAGMRDDGRTDIFGTLRALITRPQDLPALFVLGKADARARRALAGLAQIGLGAVEQCDLA